MTVFAKFYGDPVYSVPFSCHQFWLLTGFTLESTYFTPNRACSKHEAIMGNVNQIKDDPLTIKSMTGYNHIKCITSITWKLNKRAIRSILASIHVKDDQENTYFEPQFVEYCWKMGGHTHRRLSCAITLIKPLLNIEINGHRFVGIKERLNCEDSQHKVCRHSNCHI